MATGSPNNRQASKNTPQEKESWIVKRLRAGAEIRINPDQSDAKQMAKDAIGISPLYIPKIKFWAAPDVRSIYRLMCRSALSLLVRREARYESFDEVCAKNKVDDAVLNGISGKLRIAAYIALFVFFLSAGSAVYFLSFQSISTGLGAMIVSGALYWKYSFRMWQIRIRSLDKEKASVKRFMESDWYVEAFR